MIVGFPEKRVQGCFWHQGSHPTSFPLWVQAEGQSHFRSVCQEDTDGSPDNSHMLGEPVLSAACAHSQQSLSPTFSSLEMLLQRGCLPIALALLWGDQKFPSTCTWVTAPCFGTLSIWKWTTKQKCSQNLQSLIFILCQNRIPDWSNIVFWLMCFRKLVADSDWEWSLLVDYSAGENVAEIVFFINNLECAQIIFMLQVLEIGYCSLQIFITCLHLELFYLGSSFPPLSVKTAMWEKRVTEKLEQDV